MITNNDVLTVLDELFDMKRNQKVFWDDLYADKYLNIPIFTNKPDETLVDLINNHSNIFSALNIGSGKGRNSVYLVKNKN